MLLSLRKSEEGSKKSDSAASDSDLPTEYLNSPLSREAQVRISSAVISSRGLTVMTGNCSEDVPSYSKCENSSKTMATRNYLEYLAIGLLYFCSWLLQSLITTLSTTILLPALLSLIIVLIVLKMDFKSEPF